EGKRRAAQAEEGIAMLQSRVDTLIVIPNDRLLTTIGESTPVQEAFRVADDILRQGVQGISDIITIPGLVNVDFADVKAIMADAGSALMGIGTGTGKGRAAEAANMAIASPLLESSIHGAKGVLFNITGGSDLSLHEVNTAAEIIYNVVDPEANIIFGAVLDDRLQGEVRITVIATGFQPAVPSTSSLPRPQPTVRPVTPVPNHAATPNVDLKPQVEEPPPEIDIPDFLKRRRPRR
ncbi:MAG: cell division protein FtsZ, partial [Gloeomargarita sp. SKYBB_i_bin120]|nr:cell division protein FtsZ [Gloeomargarita sp. SKYB120]MDW8179300.1 cell division protein FtsZ [Gloeomargarita sp. SKYBB_i_bin120]